MASKIPFRWPRVRLRSVRQVVRRQGTVEYVLANAQCHERKRDAIGVRGSWSGTCCSLCGVKPAVVCKACGVAYVCADAGTVQGAVKTSTDGDETRQTVAKAADRTDMRRARRVTSSAESEMLSGVYSHIGKAYT